MCCNVRNISTNIVRARKDYHDDSTEFLDGILDYRPRIKVGLTFTEWRQIAQLKANRWRILKGQLYERQYNVMDGQTYTFKTLPEIAKICQKLNLYCVC
jgi:hypothetical protein